MERTFGATRIILAVAAVALLVLATAFRLYHSLGESLWLDEAYSAYAADRGFRFLWTVVPAYETHPPFYYSLLRVWTLLFGNSLAGYRSLGYVAGLAVLPVIGLAARDIAPATGLPPARLSWAAVALAGLSIVLVAMTREVRPYPVMILVYAGTIRALVRIATRRAAGERLGGAPFAAYLAGLALMLWLHNLGPLYGAALGIALLLVAVGPGMTRGDWGRLVGGHLLVAAVWAPALLILIDQAPTWVKATWLTFHWDAVPDRLALLYAAPGPGPVIAAIVLALLALWRLAGDGTGRRIAAALLVLALLPVAASVAISALVSPVFILRTMTPVAVPAMLLLAVGAAGWTGGARRWIGLGAGLILAVHMGLGDVRERQRGGQQDWYGVAAFLARHWRPGDIVLAYPNEGALPLDYALRDRGLAIPVRPIPTPVPSIGVGGWYPTGSRGVVSLPRDRLRAIAREPAIRTAPTIWLMRLGAYTYDKQDLFLTELSVGRRPATRLYWNPIDLVGLRRVDAAPPAERR